MNDWLSSTVFHENTSQNCSTVDENKTLSISDLVTQTAAQVVQQQHSEQFASLGFHWVDEWALFYNASTGYFYDPNSALFFHPNAPQMYYKFNAETGQYDQIGASGQQSAENASSLSSPAVKWSKKAFRRRANRIFGHEFVQSARQEDVEVAELTLDLVDRCAFLVGGECYDRRLIKRSLMEAAKVDDDELGELLLSVKRPSLHSAAGAAFLPNAASAEDGDFYDDDDGHGSDSDGESNRIIEEIARRQREEEIARNAPCIRLVERPRGRLHIVTICGARVGFGRSMDVQIGDDKSAPMGGGEQKEEEEKELLSIRYSPDNGIYRMEWHCCEMFVAEKNGHCLEAGTSQIVQHEDIVKIIVDGRGGSDQQQQISLSFHIHNGLNTCQGCEPGLFTNQNSEEPMERPKKRLSRYAEHRRQKRALKEQYGLLGEDAHSATKADNKLRKKYADRASRRRREVGSELPLQQPIAAMNTAGGIYAHCVAAPQNGCSSDSVRLQQQLKGDSAAFASSSTAVPINAENKGFKLLKGMGWTEGQGLGKHSQGIQGPIATQFKFGRVGLGTASSTIPSSKISINLLKSKQQSNAEQMRKRIEQIELRQIANAHFVHGKK